MIVLLCLLAGCRYRFDRVADHDGVDDGALGDADGPRTTLGGCWPAWFDHSVQFGGLRQLVETSTGFSELDPFISPDGLTLHFARGLTGNRDIYVATRPDRGAMFGAPTLSSSLTSPQDDGKVTMTSDGLVASHSAERTGSQLFDVWELTRMTTGDAFGSATQAPYALINNAVNQYDAQLTQDGLSMYYAESLMPGQEIRVATRPSRSAPFSAPAKVLGLPFGVTADPTVSPDQLLIAFIGAASAGELGQLYYATRSTIGEPFEGAQLLPDVNSGVATDGDPQITADGCELFFTSARTGNRDLFMATVR